MSSSRQADTDYDEEASRSRRSAADASAKRRRWASPSVPANEFIDRGESAKTADRPALQAMLARVESDPSIGYVFVHKIDREDLVAERTRINRLRWRLVDLLLKLDASIPARHVDGALHA